MTKLTINKLSSNAFDVPRDIPFGFTIVKYVFHVLEAYDIVDFSFDLRQLPNLSPECWYDFIYDDYHIRVWTMISANDMLVAFSLILIADLFFPGALYMPEEIVISIRNGFNDIHINVSFPFSRRADVNYYLSHMDYYNSFNRFNVLALRSYYARPISLHQQPQGDWFSDQTTADEFVGEKLKESYDFVARAANHPEISQFNALNNYGQPSYEFVPDWKSLHGRSLLGTFKWYLGQGMGFRDEGNSLISQYVAIDPQIDTLIKLAEDVSVLIYQLATSTDNLSRYVAIANYAKLRNEKISIIGLIAVKAYDLFGFNSKPEEPELQGAEEVIGNMRIAIDNMADFKDSTLVKKINKFGLYVLSLGLFPSIGLTFDSFNYGVLEQEATKRTHKADVSFLYHTLDLLVFLAEKGIQCLKLGRLDPIIHDTKNYAEWYERAVTLKRNSNFTSNPEVIPGFSVQRFLADLDECLAQATAINRMVDKKNYMEKRMIGNLIADLQLIKIKELSRRMAQKTRKSPFAVLIAGESSIGKSSLTQILFHQYAQLFDLPSEPEFKYTRLATEKHWTNFATYAWCIQCDDIAFMKPGSEPDPSLMEMLLLNNNVPYTPEQASLDDKGRTPVRAELIIATTNTENLNLHAYFSCPYAVARRFPYVIVPTVKPEYATNGALDPSKVPETPAGCFDDFWTFHIKKPVKGGDARNSPHTLETIHKFDSMSTFLKWYVKSAKDHANIQSRVQNVNDSMSKVVMCRLCSIPAQMCGCQNADPQSDSLSTKLHSALKKAREDLAKTAMDLGWKLKEDTLTYLCPLCERKVSHYCALRGENKYAYEGTVAQALEYDPSETDFNMLRNLSWFDRTKLLFIFCTFYMFSFTIINWFMMWFFGRMYKYRFAIFVMRDDTLVRRLIFKSIAHRAQNYVNIPRVMKILAISSASLLSCVAIYSIFKTPKVKKAAQGNTLSIGKAPNPDKEVIEKPFYYHDPYVLNDIDVSKTAIACPRKDFLARLERNNALFKMATEPSNAVERHVKFNNALNVGGCVWMTSSHSVPATPFYLDVIFESVDQNVSRNLKNILVTSNMVASNDNDVTFIELKHLPPMKSLCGFFTTEDFRFKGNATTYGTSKTGSKFRCTQADMKQHNIRILALDKTLKCYVGKLTGSQTVKGDCGSPLVCNDLNVILGVHLIHDDIANTIVSNAIHRDQVAWGLSHFNSGWVQGGDIVVNEPSTHRELIQIHSKSPLRFTEKGSCQVIGALSGFRVSHTSKVEDTLIRESVIKRGYKNTFGRPLMNWQPWYKGLEDLTRPVTLLDQDVLADVTKSFTQEILDYLPKGSLDMVMVYDDMTTLNGAPGVRFVDKINRNTSAGFPYKKSKRHLISEAPPDLKRGPEDIYPHKEIMDRVDAMIENYHEGKLNHPIFNGNLKDEAKKFTNMETKETKMTRVFCGASFAATIVCRKYLLSVIKLIQENTFVFESAPGIIAQSLEWEAMREYLAEFPLDRVIAGDYAAFDKRMSSTIILAAFDIIHEICAQAGYSTKDLLVVKGIAYDTAFPTVDYNGDLVTFYGSNPSGHSLTVIINGLVNALYMRYCFVKLGGDATKFKDYVKLMTYGDDNIMTVKAGCDFFNHTSIQKVLADADITYTMAEKDAASVPYIHIDQASFLKREWRWDEDVKAYLAPLDKTSFDKMLTTRVASKIVSPESHAISVIGSAVREYFFYGKEVFEQKWQMFQDIVDENNLRIHVQDSTFPTWDELTENFWCNSKHVKLKREIAYPESLKFKPASVSSGLIVPMYTSKIDC